MARFVFIQGECAIVGLTHEVCAEQGSTERPLWAGHTVLHAHYMTCNLGDVLINSFILLKSVVLHRASVSVQHCSMTVTLHETTSLHMSHPCLCVGCQIGGHPVDRPLAGSCWELCYLSEYGSGQLLSGQYSLQAESAFQSNVSVVEWMRDALGYRIC
jgi:hypothetical protein